MALAAEPDVLVLDEPTTALDATVEAEVLELVEELQSELDAAILLISHDLRVVSRLCDRVGLLYAGRLLEEGRRRKSSARRAIRTRSRCSGACRASRSTGRARGSSRSGPRPDRANRRRGACSPDRCPIVRPRCHDRDAAAVARRGRLDEPLPLPRRRSADSPGRRRRTAWPAVPEACRCCASSA